MAQTCPNCGASNLEGHRFCSICGASLTSAVAEPSGSHPPQSTGDERVVPAPSNNPVTTPHSALRTPHSDLPPLHLDRKGEATYAPYTEGAVRQVEKSSANRSRLIPFIAVASLLLLALVGTTVYLFFQPRNITVTTPDVGQNGEISAGSVPSSEALVPDLQPTRIAPTQPQDCTLPQNPTPEDEVKHVVCVSNQEQIKAWSDLNTEILAGTRTGSFLDENVALVEELKRNQIYGIPANLRIDILAVKIEGERATVTTEEKWLVTFYRLSDNSKVEKRGPDSYRETYHMVKIAGRWMIEDVDFEPIKK